MKKKITISEVNKKHLRIVCFLAISSALAYLLSAISNKPEAIYLAPVINYLIYAVKNELDGTGYREVLKK